MELPPSFLGPVGDGREHSRLAASDLPSRLGKAEHRRLLRRTQPAAEDEADREVHTAAENDEGRDAYPIPYFAVAFDQFFIFDDFHDDPG